MKISDAQFAQVLSEAILFIWDGVSGQDNCRVGCNGYICHAIDDVDASIDVIRAAKERINTLLNDVPFTSSKNVGSYGDKEDQENRIKWVKELIERYLA